MFVIYKKTEDCACKAKKGYGEKDNQGKNTHLNTYLDPPPSGAMSSSTSSIYESNICSQV